MHNDVETIAMFSLFFIIDPMSIGHVPDLQDQLLEKLLHCNPGDAQVGAYAEMVKMHCGYFRRDVRNMLRQRGLGHIEESDVKDQGWSNETPDSAANLSDK